MSDWPGRDEFNETLKAVASEKPPPTQLRIVAVAKCALEQRLFYKHVVQAVEKFASKMAVSSPGHMLACAYVIDAIVRRSQAKHGPDKDKFGPRFALRLADTLGLLTRHCLPQDRPQIDRVIKLWRENNVIVPGKTAPSPTASSSSSSSSSVLLAIPSASSSHRVSPPRTPPGPAPPSNRLLPPPSSAPPPPGPPLKLPGMLGGGPPPMMPPPMYGAAPLALSGELPQVDLDFNYDEDLPAPGTEDALTDAKRRRLEEERRVNEGMDANNALGGAAAGGPGASTDTLALLDQVMSIIHDPAQVKKLLELTNFTMADLIKMLQPAASPEDMKKLKAAEEQLAGGVGAGGIGAEAGVFRGEEAIVEQNGEKFTERWSTTVYLGNVPSTVTENEIRSLFSRFGAIVSIAHRPDTASSFVTFSTREDAEEAQREMDGFPILEKQLKTGWARGPDMRDGEFDRRTGRGLIPIQSGGAGGVGGGGGGKRARVDHYGGKEVRRHVPGGRGFDVQGGGRGGHRDFDQPRFDQQRGGGGRGRGGGGFDRGFDQQQQRGGNVGRRDFDRRDYDQGGNHDNNDNNNTNDYYGHIAPPRNAAPGAATAAAAGGRGNLYSDNGRPKVPGIDYDPFTAN